MKWKWYWFQLRKINKILDDNFCKPVLWLWKNWLLFVFKEPYSMIDMAVNKSFPPWNKLLYVGYYVAKINMPVSEFSISFRPLPNENSIVIKTLNYPYNRSTSSSTPRYGTIAPQYIKMLKNRHLCLLSNKPTHNTEPSWWG